MFTLFWAYVGPSWDYVGAMLGFVELSWAFWPILGLCCPPGVALGPCSLYFGLMLAHLGTMLGLCWVLLSCLGPMLGFVGLSLAHLGTMLRPRGCFGPMFTLFWAYAGPSWDYVGFCWVVLGLCWPILGLCWAFLGSMFGHLGSVLAYLGAMLRRLGAMEERHQSAKVV